MCSLISTSSSFLSVSMLSFFRFRRHFFHRFRRRFFFCHFRAFFCRFCPVSIVFIFCCSDFVCTGLPLPDPGELSRASDSCPDFQTSAPGFQVSASTFLKLHVSHSRVFTSETVPIFVPIREVCHDDISSGSATLCRLAYCHQNLSIQKIRLT